MKYFRKYTTVKEALDYEIENNDFVITGWPFIPAVQISNTSFERHHVHTKVGPSFNAGYFSDDFSTNDNYGRKVYLPKDWILLAYIENIIAAGGYINTGYAPSMTSTDPLTTLDFDVTFSINTLPSSGNTSTIFSIGGKSCTVNSSGNISFAGATVSTALTVNNKYTIHIHWEATSGSTGNVSMSVYNVTNLTATDKLVGTATSTAQTLTTAQLVLFDATAGLIGRLYYFGVYEDNDIKIDSVPVVGQDNMAGMYNIRNAEFMDNSRTVTGPMYMTRNVSGLVSSTGEYGKVDSLYGNSLVWNQLVQNGDFSNGSSRWSSNTSQFVINSTTGGVLTGTIKTANGAITGISQVISLISGHKYYIHIGLKLNTSNSNTHGIRVNVYSGSLVSSDISISFTNTEWNDLSTILTATATVTTAILRLYLLYSPANYAVNDTLQYRNIYMTDLTAMYGEGKEPTKAQFESMFTADYYPYNTGELLNVNAEGIKETDPVLGTSTADISSWQNVTIQNFNIWDGIYDVGRINENDGITINNLEGIYSVNYMTVVSGGQYHGVYPYSSGGIIILEYDANKTYLGYVVATNTTVTLRNNTRFIRFYTTVNDTQEGTYINDLQRQNLFPNGLCSAGTARDEVTATQAIKRVYALDLGTIAWSYNTNWGGQNVGAFYSKKQFTAMAPVADETTIPNFTIKEYPLASRTTAVSMTTNCFTFSGLPNNPYLTFRDTSKNASNLDAGGFASFLNGVILYYELATPVVVDLPRRQDYSYPVSLSTTESVVPDNSLLSVGWNQLSHNPTFSNADNWTFIYTQTYKSVTFANNMLTIVKQQGTGGALLKNEMSGYGNTSHKYYMSVVARVSEVGSRNLCRIGICTPSGGIGTNKQVLSGSTGFTLISLITSPVASNDCFFIGLGDSGTPTDVWGEFKNYRLIDLTQLFGTDEQIAEALGVSVSDITSQAAVEAFERMFPADYYPYNAGQQLYLYPTKQYYEIPVSPSVGETKPYTAPVITMNTYSEMYGSNYEQWLDRNTMWFANESSASNTISFKMNTSGAPVMTMYKSTNGINWELWGTTSTTGLSHTMGVGEKVYLRGIGNTACGISTAQNRFYISSPTSVHGNVQALLDPSEVGRDTVPTSYCFMALLNSCNGIISVDSGLLPYTTLTEGCYRGLFANSQYITSLPDGLFPATNLASECYRTLCYSCASLRRVSFTTLNDSLSIFDTSGTYTIPLLSLTIFDTVPPNIASGFFSHIESTCNIYVPDASVNAYKAAEYWSDRASYIKPLSQRPN